MTTAAWAIDNTCATANDPWSIIASAPTNSALAGVLAGLLLAAVSVLLVADTHAAHAMTIALFTTALVALALDSYLFSHVTGVQPAVNRDACMRAWTQAMPASGLLAAGGMALTGGLAWILTVYGTRLQRNLKARYLCTTGGALIATVATVTNLLLIQTSLQYLEIVGDPPPVIVGVQWITGILAVLATWLGVGRALRITTRTLSGDRPPTEMHWRAGHLKWVTYGMLLLTVSGCVFAGAVVRVAVTETAGTLLVVCSLALGSWIPNGISVAMGWCAPEVRPRNGNRETLSGQMSWYRPV